MNKKQAGFSIVEVIIVLVVLGVIGLIGWKVVSMKKDSVKPNSNHTSSSQTTLEEPKGLIWQQTENGWQSTQNPPACAEQPMLKMPADISQATSVLYPGQTRGGNYKPHGGLRFDNATNNTITVTAPIDGYIMRGARYLADGTNEVQYSFDVMNNCGIMYRVGHLSQLPQNLQSIVEAFPAASASSATQNISPAILVKQGEVLATKVGITGDKNVFFDWGVYDYRQENDASKSPAFQTLHAQDKELSWHAVCWLKGWLPASDETKLATLPAGDPLSAKNSDYCK